HGARGRRWADGPGDGLDVRQHQGAGRRRAPEDLGYRLTTDAQQQREGADASAFAPQPVLSVEGLSKTFGRRQVLRAIDLAVLPGELTVVLGANGSGKSTLLRCAMRLIEPDAGEVTLCGTDLRSARGEALRHARRQPAPGLQPVPPRRRPPGREPGALRRPAEGRRP